MSESLHPIPAHSPSPRLVLVPAAPRLQELGSCASPEQACYRNKVFPKHERQDCPQPESEWGYKEYRTANHAGCPWSLLCPKPPRAMRGHRMSGWAQQEDTPSQPADCRESCPWRAEDGLGHGSQPQRWPEQGARANARLVPSWQRHLHHTLHMDQKTAHVLHHTHHTTK